MLQVFIHLILAAKKIFITLKAGDNKIPGTSVLVTTAVLNTKIGEVENKTPGVSNIGKKTQKRKNKSYGTKYFTTAD